MDSIKLQFELESHKKYSIRYKNEEEKMVVYVPKDLLAKLKDGEYPQRLQITISLL